MQPIDWQQLWQLPSAIPAPPGELTPAVPSRSDWGGLRPPPISLRRYQAPPLEQTFRYLFGQEPTVDPYIGQWVYTPKQ